MLDSCFTEGDSDGEGASPPFGHTGGGGDGFDSSPEGVGWQWADDGHSDDGHSEVSNQNSSYYDSAGDDERTGAPGWGGSDAEGEDGDEEGSEANGAEPAEEPGEGDEEQGP